MTWKGLINGQRYLESRRSRILDAWIITRILDFLPWLPSSICNPIPEFRRDTFSGKYSKNVVFFYPTARRQKILGKKGKFENSWGSFILSLFLVSPSSFALPFLTADLCLPPAGPSTLSFLFSVCFLTFLSLLSFLSFLFFLPFSHLSYLYYLF